MCTSPDVSLDIRIYIPEGYYHSWILIYMEFGKLSNFEPEKRLVVCDITLGEW